MKSPPIQHRDEAARDETERFIAANARTAATPAPKTARPKANGKAAEGRAKAAKTSAKS